MVDMFCDDRRVSSGCSSRGSWQKVEVMVVVWLCGRVIGFVSAAALLW